MKWNLIVAITLTIMPFQAMANTNQIPANGSCEPYTDDYLLENVGQLIIAASPADVNNYSGSPDVKKLISTHRVGNLFFPNYKYLNASDSEQASASAAENARNYHWFLRQKYLEEGLPPPIFFVDYESASLSAFTHLAAIDPPVEALTLSATNNSELIHKAGMLYGLQLQYMGIDAIFGPNVDFDRNQPEQPVAVVGQRVFGEEPTFVIATASHYLAGMKATGTFTFIKHYPGFGSIRGSVHNDNLPQIMGGVSTFETNTTPYRVLASNNQPSRLVDGIMSSHVLVPGLDEELATFSKRISQAYLRGTDPMVIEGGRALNPLSIADEIILITDDLSAEQPIKYRIESNTNYDIADASIDAIEAGHDMLLFSNVNSTNPSSGEKKSLVDVDMLGIVIQKVREKASSDQRFMEKIGRSLCRVLKKKNEILLHWQQEKNDIYRWEIPPRIQTGGANLISTTDPDNKSVSAIELNRRILDSAFIVLQGSTAYKKTNDETVIFCRSKSCESFKEERSTLVDLSKISFEEAKSEIKKSITTKKKTRDDRI